MEDKGKYSFPPEFQIQLLALMVKDIPFLRENRSIIKPQYFDNPLFARFCKLVGGYHQEYGSSPSKAVLGELLGAKEGSPEQFLFDRIYDIAITDVEYITESVRRFAKHQAVKRHLVFAERLLASEEYDKIEKGLYEALHTGEGTFEGPHSYFEGFEKTAVKWKSETERKVVIETLIPEVDDALNGGIRPAELNVVMGPPGAGKSIWLINMAYAALFMGKSVLYLSMEMSTDWIEKRLTTRITGIPTHSLLSNLDEVVQRVKEMGLVMGEIRTQFWPASTATVSDVRGLLESLAHKDGFKPDLVLVDYLELMDVSSVGGGENDYDKQGRLAKILRGLSAEFSFGLWVATQARRSALSKTHLKMDDKADSFKVMMDADVVLGLLRTDENESENIVTASFVKLRNSGAMSFVKPLRGNYEKMFIGTLT